MKYWILAAATVLLTQGADAREHYGPPSVCPQPKVDCKPKCPPAPCAPKPCAPKTCKPKACKPACPKPDPCCPPVCFERGFPTSACCTPTAYSEPAGIELRCGWDTFVDVSFIYWEAIQGGMELAVPGQSTLATGVFSAPAFPSSNGHSVLQQEFEYKPGFQVGLGWAGGKDNWSLYAEYTWLHGSTHTSSTAGDSGVSSAPTGVWLPTSWLYSKFFTSNATTHISSEWTYKIDLVDAEVSRPFYSGARYTVEPFFGLRGAWIRQHMDVEAASIPASGGDAPTFGPTREADYNSRSSAVGPRIGMNGNWHLGYGLRFMGNAAASLLFTGYDVKQNMPSPGGGTLDLLPIKIKQSDLNVLRPNLDLSLGLGWGSYFCCRRMHWDLAATYDFSVFWAQNMMRYLADTTNALTGASPADLYLQGLTIKTRFDF